ncbi:MAG: hypothetical protein ACRD5M_11615 [Candidatus Acidiferrales bacterium]
MRPSRRFILSLHAIFIFVLLIAVPYSVRAQTPAPQPSQLPPAWNDAVHALAEKISSAAGSSRLISLEVKNISSLDASAPAEIRQALESELNEKGIKSTSSGLPVHVTLSESADGIVWIAEINRSGDEQALMVSLPSSPGLDLNSRPAPVLQKRTVWEQSEPFLDFDERTMMAGLFKIISILEFDRVVNYRAQGVNIGISLSSGRYSSDVLPFTPTNGSRDLRGRLFASEHGQLKLFMAGTLCTNATIIFQCIDVSAGEWPVADAWKSTFVSNRNYFSGLSPDSTVISGKQPSFFTLSRLEYDHGSDWLLTELDGMARLYESSNHPQTAFSGWGDEVATVKPGCGASWQVLVTGTGDWTQPDHIQLYEISNSHSLAVGQRVEFPGPILALWQSDDRKSVRVVSRNLQSGMYEASIVSVSCSD